MEEMPEYQPPNSLPKKWDTKTLMEVSEAPPTPAADTTGKASQAEGTCRRYIICNTQAREGGSDLEAIRSNIPSPGLANSRHGPFDGLEGGNSILEEPEKLRVDNSMALVAVYEGILETLAQMNLDLQNLEDMMLDYGYISGYVSEDEHAEEEESEWSYAVES
ncbi:hypothetical protein N7453_006392 [Penicillium expansum]|nr:hypothetical protein N7453_006392 [Penicillium expansum]